MSSLSIGSMTWSRALLRSSGVVSSRARVASAFHAFESSFPMGFRSSVHRPFPAPLWRHSFSSSPVPSSLPTKTDGSESLAGKVNEVPKTAPGRIRQLWNKYGYVAIGTYGGIYLATLSSVYLLLESSLISAGDSIELLKSMGLGNLVDLSAINPKAGNFAVAWILTKFTEPARAAITFMVTPRIAKLMRFKRST